MAKRQLAKARAAKQNKNTPETNTVNPETVEEQPVLPAEPREDTVETDQDVDELKRQVAEMRDMMWGMMKSGFAGQPSDNSPEVLNGKLTGTVEKYALSADLYPNPAERLAKEPKLQRFAFSINYELDYQVSNVSYTTIDNVRMTEPKFTLTLVKVMLDEDTGEDTGGRYDICKFIFHEDPDTALTIARDMGMDISEMDEATFLNEMRYIRMRDWLIDAFYPPKIVPEKSKRDMVINGRVVQFWQKNTDANGNDSGFGKPDWDNLPKIKF